MSMEKKVPEIRFKGFSEPWNEEIIQELIDRQAITGHLDGNHGELYPRANEFSNAGIPYISANDFVTGFMSFSSCKYLPTQRALQFKKGIAKDGDILFAHNATVGPVAKLTTSHDFVILSTTATYFRCDNKTLINDYLLQALSNKKFVEQYSRVMAQSTRNQVPITVQRKFSISIPENTSEQIQIGNYFQKLDELINQHQQKHDKLNSIKKAMLEKMFPKQGETIPEIRFKGFSGEWGKEKLVDVTDITMGQSPSGENYTDNPNDHILVQGNADLKNGFVVPRVWTSEVTKTATKGALIFSVRAPVGEVGKTNYDVVLGRGVAAIYGNEFVYQQLKKLKSDNYWYTVSAGSTFEAISSSELASTFIWVSSDSEQEIVGGYFQKLDELINQHQQQITKLNNIKQACLSKMFV